MNPTQDTLALVKAALGADDISKSITTANGLIAYDLQAPAKNLYPVFTPLRNRIPRVAGGKGVATNWKVISSIVGSGFDNGAWIPEGQRSGRMSYSTAPKAANYVTIGEEDSVTFEAVNAGKTFEDVRATMAVRLLQKLMLKEETAIIGGNASLQLGTPTAATLTATGTSATLPAQTYSVIVVALTQEGYFNSSLAGGVATTKTVTGADGAAYTLNGGSSNKSASATQAITLGQSLGATVPLISGAVAYAWFVGSSGSEKLEAITTTNTVTFSAPLTGGARQAATAITIDASANPGLAYDGLLTAALNPANAAYVAKLAPGGTLTSSGRGSVVEIDTLLRSMWDQYQLSPTVIYMNSQEINNVTQKCMTSSQGSLVRMNANAQNMSEPYAVIAGGVVNSYFNPFMPDGGAVIPVKIHPKLPPGTLIAYCENLPIYYQNNEVTNVAEIKCRQDYYQVDWPLRTRQYETGVYSEEVLAIYAPFSLGVISNITNG
jgi:hypothetical protein